MLYTVYFIYYIIPNWRNNISKYINTTTLCAEITLFYFKFWSLFKNKTSLWAMNKYE